MNITLYESELLDENGKLFFKRSVNCSFDSKGDLIVYCCDIGTPVKSFYNDSGVEFYIVIKENELPTLRLLLKTQSNSEELLAALRLKFIGENCFNDIKAYCTQNNIKHEFSVWR
ncbi:MAG: hypothetical protein K0S32_2364 [Bacteroidetes bacterium]|jgi:hypothetical protein|nr:hypothetical protein [Bacteroidota bacterium]